MYGKLLFIAEIKVLDARSADISTHRGLITRAFLTTFDDGKYNVNII